MTMTSLRMMQMGQKHEPLWPLTLEAVGGEAEVVVEYGEEDSYDDEPEDDRDWDRNMRLCGLSS